MAMNDLKSVYIDQLQDIYSADRQSETVTRKLAEMASDRELKAALKRGIDGIDQGKQALAHIIRSHEAEPTGEFCKGMEGLAKEAEAHVLQADFGDDDVRDAMIISQYQRMAHYAIAGYGCCAAFARRLGYEGEAKTLQDCLDNTYHGDKEMTRIAIGSVNPDAA
ncbi:MAG: DUF892 family protein [Alphaproteobacteria bacterium]|jgi:ferritin-like metal-binding protein YciE|nr:DUF892 family protein [Alphaproteobacteria bacterium]